MEPIKISHAANGSTLELRIDDIGAWMLVVGPRGGVRALVVPEDEAEFARFLRRAADQIDRARLDREGEG